MHGIERLDIVSDESDQLCHHCFDARWISGRIRYPHQHPVETLVVGAHKETLASRPFG